MTNIFKKGATISAVLLALTISFYNFNAISKEDIKELSMPTDVGEIVLTVEPCPLNPNYGFEYLAYATDDKEPDHLGCWQVPADIEGLPSTQIVNIWFPEINAIASYNKKLFTPRKKV
jgi:hypothetical protein